MPFEPIIQIREGIGMEDCILRTGQSVTFSFDADHINLSANHDLYFTAETRMHYLWKDEIPYSKSLMDIDDSLDTVHAGYCRYCIDLSADKPKQYPKMLLHKLLWPPREGLYEMLLYTQQWRYGIRVRAEGLRVLPNGYLRVRLERWEKKDGVPTHVTTAAPDETYLIDIPEGSYDYRVLSRDVCIPDTTACVLMTIEGMGYQGNVYLEQPHVTAVSSNRNIMPDFIPAPAGQPKYEHFAWFGYNLSKKEWPEFDITLNGRSIFSGETFLQMQRYAPVELPIPSGILRQGRNELQIRYCSDYHDVVPMAIRDISILEKAASPVHIAALPKVAFRDEEISVLLESAHDHVTFNFESEDFELCTTNTLLDKGLHVMRLRPKIFRNHAVFSISAEGQTETAEIEQMVDQHGENILCGSGDMIYVDNSSIKAVYDYLEWYLHNRLGNMITVRPRYHWSNNRVLNPEVWKLFTRICNQMQIHYPHMSDGDELMAAGNNPTEEMLAGPYFQGLQDHECDGRLFYWSFPAIDTHVPAEYYDLAARLERESAQTLELRLRSNALTAYNGEMEFLRDISCKPDMKDAYEHVMPCLRECRKGANRHTGPATMFKYFYQAGFDWVGVETMYQSLEPQMAFLRGAARAYGKTRSGVHLALQWSTYPHDTERRYRRYLLALLIPYIHGVTDFNTEEGWRFMETHYDAHDRFSPACTHHREQEQRFFRYTQSHSRTGRYTVPIALLHGRYDGWCGVGGTRIFGMPHIRIGEAEASWQILKAFYPNCSIQMSGLSGMETIDFPTTKEEAERPRGFYSGTPNGNVDVIPIENGKFLDYSIIAFAGYNAAETDDFDRLLDFVRKGGTLVGCWPHFSQTTLRADIDAKDFVYLAHPLTAALSCGAPEFCKAHVNGKAIRICKNPASGANILRATDEGDPLLCEIKLGSGRIILLNVVSYPGDEAVRAVYEEEILSLRKELVVQEETEILCGDDVEYGVYLQENGSRHYYLTPVDWYRDSAQLRKATFRMAANKYEVELPFGCITKLVTTGQNAVWSADENVDLISIDGHQICVQGYGKGTVHVITDKGAYEKELNFDVQNLQKVQI